MGLIDKLGLPPQPKAQPAAAQPAAAAPPKVKPKAAAEPSLLDRAGQYGREKLEEAKGYGRDKVLEGLGTVKGVVTQVTEVADTAMWVGDEAKKLRDRAADAVGGQKGTLRRQIVDGVVDGVGQGLTAFVPGLGGGNLGDAAKSARELGLVDDKGKASITAPMTAKLNDAAKWVEKKVGGKPADPALLSAMELAELKASIGVQAGLALTGVEEVKVVMNIAGTAGALRGLVEAVRANPKNWHKDTAVWSGVIGVALGVLGLKNTMAAGKITTIALKYGWLAQAVPPLTRIGIDHFDTTLTPKQREERDKENFKAAMMVVKDAVLHVVESQSAKPPPGGKPGPEPEAPAAKPAAPAKPLPEPPAAKPAAPAKPLPEPPVAKPAAPARPQPEPPRVDPALATRLARGKPANDNAELPAAPVKKAVPVEAALADVLKQGKAANDNHEVAMKMAAGAEGQGPVAMGPGGSGGKSKPTVVPPEQHGSSSGSPPKAGPKVPPKAPPKPPAKPAPVTIDTVAKVKGMDAVLNRMANKGLKFNDLEISQKQLVDMVNKEPVAAVKALNDKLDVREVMADAQRGSSKEKIDAPHQATDPEPLWSRASTVGKNPSKDSPTGRAVIARMRSQKLITGEPGQEMVFHKDSKKWYPIAECEMGHTHDAVTWWNNEGRFFGSKSPQVKAWMNRPDIYELEPGSINSARGAQIGDNYKSPHPDPITPDEMKGIVKDRSKPPAE